MLGSATRPITPPQFELLVAGYGLVRPLGSFRVPSASARAGTFRGFGSSRPRKASFFASYCAHRSLICVWFRPRALQARVARDLEPFPSPRAVCPSRARSRCERPVFSPLGSPLRSFSSRRACMRRFCGAAWRLGGCMLSRDATLPRTSLPGTCPAARLASRVLRRRGDVGLGGPLSASSTVRLALAPLASVSRSPTFSHFVFPLLATVADRGIAARGLTGPFRPASLFLPRCGRCTCANFLCTRFGRRARHRFSPRRSVTSSPSAFRAKRGLRFGAWRVPPLGGETGRPGGQRATASMCSVGRRRRAELDSAGGVLAERGCGVASAPRLLLLLWPRHLCDAIDDSTLPSSRAATTGRAPCASRCSMA